MAIHVESFGNYDDGVPVQENNKHGKPVVREDFSASVTRIGNFINGIFGQGVVRFWNLARSVSIFESPADTSSESAQKLENALFYHRTAVRNLLKPGKLIEQE